MNSVQVALNGSFRVQELEIRFKPNRKRSPVDIFSPDDVHKFLAPLIANEPREKLIVLSIAPGNGVVGMEIVSQGTSDSSPASPREVFKAAMLTNAESVIIVHNHPSGKVEPSQADRALFLQLKQAAEILDIRLLDFVVLSKDKFYSFAQEGELPTDDLPLSRGVKEREQTIWLKPGQEVSYCPYCQSRSVWPSEVAGLWTCQSCGRDFLVRHRKPVLNPPRSISSQELWAKMRKAGIA